MRPPKKQIVFIEPVATIPTFKIARALTLTGRYETVLISFSKAEDKFLKKAFDRIITIELDYPLSPGGLFKVFRTLLTKEARLKIQEIKKLNPYVVQATGSHYLTWISLVLARKYPRVFFLYDIWQYYKRKFSFRKNSGRLQYFNPIFERFCLRNTEVLLNKSGEGSLSFLDYKLKMPVLDFVPNCLDEWIIRPKSRKSPKNREAHIVYPGCAWNVWEGHLSFPDIIDRITSQKIHFHLYPTSLNKETEQTFISLSKSNKYFHLHRYFEADKLNREISKYDYGILPDFCDSSISPLWVKTSMSGKMFAYIEAGLPVILQKPCGIMVDLLKDSRTSIPISAEELSSLSAIIKNAPYPSSQALRKTQEKFRISKKMPALEKFYAAAYNLKKK